MRRPSNPLALAVLVLLFERPMHPYEMSSTLRFRRKDESIKINYGSLYAVVESLEKKGLVDATERVREGRRPERTVYTLTEAGESAMHEWLGQLIAQPTNQYTDFEAALSLMPALVPEIARSLLAARLEALTDDDRAYQQSRLAIRSFPRLFTIESEYQAVLRRAEIEFVRELLRDLDDGSFDGLAGWRRFHELRLAGRSAEFTEELFTT